MDRTSRIATVALGAALALGAVGVGTAVLPSIAGAQGSEATAAADTGLSHGGARHGHPRLRHLARQEAQVAADTIGIPVAELRDGVRSGQSIAEIAEAHDVSTASVVDAVVGDLTTKLDEAVADGKLTQERAAAIEQRLPARIDDLVHRHRAAGQRGN
jgi:hypothetical protein